MVNSIQTTSSSRAATSSQSAPVIEQISISSGRTWCTLSKTDVAVGIIALILLAAKAASAAQNLPNGPMTWALTCCPPQDGMCYPTSLQGCRELYIPVTNETLSGFILPFFESTKGNVYGYTGCVEACRLFNQLLKHGEDYSTFVYEATSGAPMAVVAHVVTLIGLFALNVFFND